jgi:hypothetical protein
MMGGMAGSAEARKVLRELNNELRAAGETAGRSLVWTAQDRAVLELIADQTDRRAELAAEYAGAEDTMRRVKLSAELRLLEGSLARLLKQVKTDVPAPESQVTIQARRAAMKRWHPDATG